MIILGIDPGTNATGFGIIRFDRNVYQWIASGTLSLPAKKTLFQKLETIYDHIVDLTHQYHPTELSIENVFYSKNVNSALKLGHARAAAILGALHKNLSINEYSPKDMKMAVVGNGNASKEQVQYMVKKILKIGQELGLDESDALGLAICHANRLKSPKKAGNSWKAFLSQHPELIKK